MSSGKGINGCEISSREEGKDTATYAITNAFVVLISGMNSLKEINIIDFILFKPHIFFYFVIGF